MKINWKRGALAALSLAVAAACAGPGSGAPTPSVEATLTVTAPEATLTPQPVTATVAVPATRRAAATRPPEPSATRRPAPTPPSLPTRALAQRLPIIEYHYATFFMAPDVQMQPAWFEAQLQWLADQGYTTLSSAQLVDFVAGRWAPPAPAVALTFDVGASHFAEYREFIIPALRRHGFQAIFFVMPSQTRAVCEGDFACWPDLLAWRDEGLIALESHTLTHYDFTTLPPERLALDIAGSKRAIEAQTGQPVLGLSYPFDAFAEAAPELLAEAGYAYAVAGAARRDRSAHFADASPFNLPRYYPYSGEAFYPRLGGPDGMTFAELMVTAGEGE